MNRLANIRKERSESLQATAYRDEIEPEEGLEDEEDALIDGEKGDVMPLSFPDPRVTEEERNEKEKDEKLYSNSLLHVVSALGGRDLLNGKYIPGDEASDCIRDLKRYLRMDEEYNQDERPCHVLLAKWNILSTDLLPLLLVSVENENWKLAIATCEILVPLTWPVTDPTKIKDMDRVRSYKVAFLKPGVWSAIIRVILHLSATPYRKRSEKDQARLTLIISLIRNVLAINDFHDSSVNTSNEAYLSATCQEELVAHMVKEDVIELLLSLAASTNEFEYQSWSTLLLEIFFHIFQYRVVEDMLISNVEQQKSKLQDLMAKENLKRKPTSTRHARFGGTFVLKTGLGQVNVRSLDKIKKAGSHELSMNSGFDNDKKSKADGRNKPMDIFTRRPLEMTSSKKVFREVAVGFLENCFTNLLTSVKKDFDVDRYGLVEANYLHYFAVYSFFLEFHLATHLGEDNLDNVTGMISHSMTVFILRRMSMYREEKNYKALYFTTKSLQFYLGVLKRMDSCVDEGMRQASVAVQSQFFYESAHISSVVNLARDSKPRYWRHLVSVAECIYSMGDLMKTNFGEKGVAVTKNRKGANDGSDEEDFLHYERIYTIDSFFKQCAYESVIDTYCYIITHFEHLSDVATIKHITQMFDIISRTDSGCNLAPLFYTASTFHVFHTFLNSPASRAPQYEPLKNVIRFICAEAMTRVTENPYIVIDFFFSKTRGDCNRLLGNDDLDSREMRVVEEEEPESAMTEEDLVKEFGAPNPDEGLRGEQIRKLCKYLTRKSTEDADCIRWLASSMRIVLYEDFEDMFEGEDFDQTTVFLSSFIYLPSTPFYINDFLSSTYAKLLLALLDFIPVPSEDSYRFPQNLTIELIEHVERAKLFAKRYIPPPKKGRKAKAIQPGTTQPPQEPSSDEDASEDGEEDGVVNVKTKKKRSLKDSSGKRRSASGPRGERKEKEGLRIKSAQFVVDSSDEEDDEAFFKAEAALRLKKDLMAREGILSNGPGPATSKMFKKPSPPRSALDPEDSEDEQRKGDRGIQKEQETLPLEPIQDSGSDEEMFVVEDPEEKETPVSSQQKRIQAIMDESDLSSDDDAVDKEQEAENKGINLPVKPARGKSSKSIKDSPAVAPIKKRARVIQESDSD